MTSENGAPSRGGGICTALEIPQALIPALRRLVDELEADATVRWAAANRELVPGFPLRARNAPHFRRVLWSKIAKDCRLPEDLRQVLAAGSLNRRVLAVLSEEALAAVAVDLGGVLGAEAVRGALFVDERPGVRALAEAAAWVEEVGGNGGSPGAVAEALGPFLRAFEPFFDAASGRRVAAEVARLRARVEKLEGVRLGAKKAKALDRRAEAQDAAAEKASRALERARADAAEWLQRCKALEERLREAEAARDAAQANREGAVAAGIAAGLRSALRPWLEAPLAAQAERERIAGEDDLLADAEAALARQVEVDRHAGNRRALGERRDQVAAALARVQAARAEALRPLPELASVAARLGAELERLDRVLGRSVSAAAAALAGRINAVEAPDDLLRLRATLDELRGAEALPGDELARLYGAYHRRLTRFLDAGGPVPVPAALRRDPAYGFRRALVGGEPVLLLIDGHNVLHRLAERFEEAFEDGRPGARARDVLVQKVEALVARTAGGRAQVYFDSPTASRETRSPRVAVIYSGGGRGRDRADGSILEDATFHAASGGGEPRWLVTSDAPLGAQAAAVGCAVLSAEEFAQFLTLG